MPFLNLTLKDFYDTRNLYIFKSDFVNSFSDNYGISVIGLSLCFRKKNDVPNEIYLTSDSVRDKCHSNVISHFPVFSRSKKILFNFKNTSIQQPLDSNQSIDIQIRNQNKQIFEKNCFESLSLILVLTEMQSTDFLLRIEGKMKKDGIKYTSNISIPRSINILGKKSVSLHQCFLPEFSCISIKNKSQCIRISFQLFKSKIQRKAIIYDLKKSKYTNIHELIQEFSSSEIGEYLHFEINNSGESFLKIKNNTDINSLIISHEILKVFGFERSSNMTLSLPSPSSNNFERRKVFIWYNNDIKDGKNMKGKIDYKGINHLPSICTISSDMVCWSDTFGKNILSTFLATEI